MTQKHWSHKPNSFAEVVELIQQHVRNEILREAQGKQLYYHNLDHALAVKRRAISIFQAIKPALEQNYSAVELSRMEGLISLCGLAHDMVQVFEPTPPQQSRTRKSGLSEKLSADRLLKYIQELNQAFSTESIASSLLISDREQQILYDGIMATVCIRDPEAGRSEYIFSDRSIYQPYLYDTQSKISIVGTIIALADLGTLGMDGAEAYIQDGISIFFEDNPHLDDLVMNCDLTDNSEDNWLRIKLLAMNSFIVDLAKERQARFELEIAGFSTQARWILQNQVFIYLNPHSIERIQSMVPLQSDTSLAELISFFHANHNSQIQSSILPS
ncbi:MAG: hypothetical protein AAFO95_14975 [Cyanobacteria bacterium J06600_6]